MTTAPGNPRSRTLLIALLTGIGVLLIAGIVAVILLLRPTVPGTDATPRPTITGLPESARPTITPTPTGVPAPPGDETFPSTELQEQYRSAFESGDTDPLRHSFSPDVEVTLAGSECCGVMPRPDAVAQLDYVMPGSGASWNFAPDAALLDAMRAGDYADFFPEDALVGVSSDGYLLSFVPGADQLVARVLITTAP